MNVALYNAGNLPKFDAGINSCEDFELLHHNHAPRFVARVHDTDGIPALGKVIEWIDPTPPADELRELLREAFDWWMAEDAELEAE